MLLKDGSRAEEHGLISINGLKYRISLHEFTEQFLYFSLKGMSKNIL
jgi:hypothetical protein